MTKENEEFTEFTEFEGVMMPLEWPLSSTTYTALCTSDKYRDPQCPSPGRRRLGGGVPLTR